MLYSGGRDSTCLLAFAVEIVGRQAVRALHVNYGLREAADGDEGHCAELCERLGVVLDVRHPRRPSNPAKPARGNLQAWARDARYGPAAQIALECGGDVAAGHTATDQVETILYRLASSPSRRALLGMRPREGWLVRPLLHFTRAQTAEYCERRGLAWREDESNQSDAFARNRIRHGLLPALDAIHPGAQSNVLALAQTLRDEAEVLDAAVDGVLAGGEGIELERLRALPVALRRLVLQRLADEAVGGLAPGVARRAEEIVALGDSAARQARGFRGCVKLDLAHGVRAVLESGVLRFERRGAEPVKVTTAIRPTAKAHAVRGKQRAAG